MLKPETAKMASQDQLTPETNDTAFQAWFPPNTPDDHVQAQPFDPIKPIVNPPPASCQYAPCPLLGSFTTPSPYQRHYLPQNFGPCVDILPRGQDCWGEVCQVSPLTLSVKALCILLQPGAQQHTSGFAHLFSFTCPLVLGPVSSLVMSTCFCVFS